jgi:hypothetical protein
MTRVDDRVYYEARAKAERQLAASSRDSAIAALHVQLAEEYERRLSNGSDRLAEVRGE